MGCGASTDITSAVIAPNANVVNLDVPPTTPVSSVITSKILITSHSSQQAISERLRQGLIGQNLSCHLLNESTPSSLTARANVIQWCDVFVLVLSRFYQRTRFCIEAIIYAKDMHKPVIVIYAEPTFRPYGALGAIAASAVRSIILKNDSYIVHAVSDIANAAHAQVKNRADAVNVIDPIQADKSEESKVLPAGSKQCDVLICTTDDGDAVAQIIFEALIATQPLTIVENLSKLGATCSVENCTVLVAVLTPQLEQSSLCQSMFEQARLLNKPIVPVIAVRKWRPTGWLGLVIAGRVFFRIFDQETAYKPFYDSSRINDLRLEIEIASLPVPSEAEREEIEKKMIEQEIEQYKAKLSTWPPKRKSRVINSIEPRKSVRVQIPEPHAEGYFDHTHHSIERIDFKPPPPILDQYGLPKRRTLDCMISYQWKKQELVRQVYEDLNMRYVQTWFDIWYSMQGGTNDAMAIGVECAKVLLVFLSREYIQSVNCQLEFRYAVQRGKAFVIIRTEDNIQAEQWMLEAMEGFPHYDVYSYDVLAQLINGVPMIDVIVQAVRTLAQAQPPDSVDDCSAELSELRSLLDDARDALSEDTGQTRYKTCTRCEQNYDEYNKDGCKKHAAYFLGGGGLLEDQWVCCRQQTADSPGCIPCQHIDQPRIFVEDPTYGSSTWKPA